MKYKILSVGLLVLSIAVILSGCAAPEAPAPLECPEVECPSCPTCPEPVACPEPEACPEYESILPGIEAAWAGSGHADAEAEAFRHWDEEDPAVVSTSCGKCHSTAGSLDFYGVDGTEAGTVEGESPALENMGIQCAACHNQATAAKDSVVMPSGLEITGLGSEARCMECHQGRHSLTSLNASITEAAGVEDAWEADPDAVYDELGFSNVHYYPAAATKYGTLAKGGGEYAGKAYDGNFAHVEQFDTCIECHSSHTLEVQGEGCVECHGEGEFQDYRMLSSAVDYDGDGDIEEGISYEISGLAEILLAEIEAYAAANSDLVEIAYIGNYPYWGAANEGEELLWTPRLARAAYNYQLAIKDPGNFAHGGKYTIQLVYDSIEDLGGYISLLNRDDHGNFQGSAEAFRHWDPGTRAGGVVSGDCARCHSSDGLPTYHAEGVNISTAPANGFLCETCHGGEEWPALRAFTSVTFPSGMMVSPVEGDVSVVCMQCHQGRESGADVDEAIESGLVKAAAAFEEAVTAAKEAGEPAPVETEPDGTVLPGQGFLNVHYFAAGATRYGSEAGGGYEYADKEYVGVFAHVPGIDTCVACHDAHKLELKTEQCLTCHAGLEDVHDIRMSEVDFDGDGDAAEGIYGEIDTMKEALYTAIIAYSIDTEVTNEVAYLNNYPYWGAANDGEDLFWTPTLLRSAYNYQYVKKDPGGFAHNGAYVLQLLYDSIEAVGGDVSAMTRP